jgi:hypothetical protein
MKTRVALLLLLVAAAMVIAAILAFPGLRPAAPPRPVPRPVPQAEADPRQVVAAYLGALEKKDFSVAYGHLSQGSRKAHPYDEFVRLAERSGAPAYDLAAAEEKRGEEGKVVVAVPLSEDVARASFTMVKEGGSWKVVFIGGAPSFPYP